MSDGGRARARRLVVDLGDRRPIWRIPGWVASRIREALPPEWELVVVGAAADGTADGAGAASAEALAAVEAAEVYLGFGIAPAILKAGRGLRWVHTGTAGVGSSIGREMLAADLIFTNSAGTHAPPVAETVLAMILHFCRGIDWAVRAQADARWWKAPFDTADTPLRELSRRTVGIVGLGGIGTEVAWRVGALGARVIGLRRRSAERVEGVDVVYGADGLHRLLGDSDFVVLAVPETPDTRRLVDAAALHRMRPDAVLINVARGGIVDQDALVEALRAGRLRGAGLDVFDGEPLPPDHPLWHLPNVLITPHVSAYTHHYWERETSLILDNLGRYLSGRPLVNVVDKHAGY